MSPATHRVEDEVEDGLDANESSPLLRENGQENDDDQFRRRRFQWSEYPEQWLSQVKTYARDFQTKRKDRGKRRQQNEMNDTEIANAEHQETGLRAKLNRFRSENPTAFAALSALAGLILAVLFLFLIVLFHLLFVTLRNPSEATQQRILTRSFNIDGPDNVEVVGLTDNGLTVRIEGRIGIDADAALDEWLGKKSEIGWWKRKDRDWVEWAINKVAGVQVDIDSMALRSPDWSVERQIDQIDLIPDDGKKDLYGHVSSTKKKTLPPPPTDLVTFAIEPLLVPVPQVGNQNRRGLEDDAPEATTPINLTVVLKPSGPALLQFAEYTLQNKTAYLDVRVSNAHVRGLNFKDWARGRITSSSWWGVTGWINLSMPESWKRLAQQLPKMDGNDTNTDDFLNLTRYDFAELGGPGSPYPERALGLDAYAEAMNPLGKILKGHVPYSLPFGAFLPVKKDTNSSSQMIDAAEEYVLLAAVATEPFDIHGEDKIPLKLHGRVIPPPQPPSLQPRSQSPLHAKGKKTPSPQEDAAGQALGDFLSRFLRGDPNTLIVRGGNPFATPKVSTLKKGEMLPMPGGGSDDLPAWLDRLLRTVSVPISFPGSPVTDLIQNISISDLKITPHPFGEDKFTCSGVIMGVMNMPGQLATVDVQITDLWPDVLIFNGKPPSMKHGKHKKPKPPKDGVLEARDKKDDDDSDGDGDDDDTPIPDPLPDPLPEHAFGRIVPHKWAPAETYIDPEDPKGERKLLRSELKDVPFTLLPGRRADFQSFSWKIITGEGAKAGIDGKAKAKIWNSGLGKLLLQNLPVQGVFTVGKRGSGGDDGDGDGDDGLMISKN